MIRTLVTALALLIAQPDLGPDDPFIEVWETVLNYTTGPQMPPRLPILQNGDPLYSLGEPVYGVGADLGTAASTANYVGNTDVARRFVAGEGVRLCISSNSQFANGESRGLKAIQNEWPFRFSVVPVMVTTTNEIFDVNKVSTTVDYLYSTVWHRTDVVSNLGVAASTLFTNSGIGDISQIPMAWTFLKAGASSQFFANLSIEAGNGQTDHFFYDDNWIDDDGVWWQDHIALVCGGNTDLNTGGGSYDMRLRFQGYIPNTTKLFTSLTTHTIPSVDSKSVTLSVANGSASLTMISTGVNLTGTATAPFRPWTLLEEDDAIDNKETFILPGYRQRYTDATTPATDFGIYLVRAGAARSPEQWMSGADNGSAIFYGSGGDFDTRQWMWENYGSPNTLMYFYGHNNFERDITVPKAESVFQADLFDLIHQDASDIFALTGAYPDIVLGIPWAETSGINMDQARHDEMVAIVNALNAVGIPTIGADMFNKCGGATYDNVYPLDGTHPLNKASARGLWGTDRFFGIMQEAAADTGSGGNRSRDRKRER